MLSWLPRSASASQSSHLDLASPIRWRHSMFWRLLPMLFLVSSFATLLTMVSATFRDDTRLREALSPARLAPDVLAVARASPPLAVQNSALVAWCDDRLHVLSERILSKAMVQRAGDSDPNSFHYAVQSGRLAVTLRDAAGMRCTFPADGTGQLPALRDRMRLAERRKFDGQQEIVDAPGGWISVTTVEPARNPGARLTIGVQILSPLAKLAQPREVLRPLSLFLLVINTAAALFLVALVVRRIRRADEVVQAWTLGDLESRIHDTGHDEFSRLTHKLDVMADALSGVIKVQQALAASEERNRLARDLHDSSKQRAFALNLQLSALQRCVDPNSDIARMVAISLTLTSQLQQDLDSVIQRLAAPTIAEAGFRHVLGQGIDALLAGRGIAWSLDLKDDDEIHLNATPDIARQLLLITVEAVANALKHAECTSCWIRGERIDDVYSWSIADNGSAPFPSNVGTKGMGLANMRLRALSLPQGTFATLSREGGGTTVRVRFHLKGLEPK